VLKSTLAELPQLAQRSNLQSPTLLVVGEVAALAQLREPRADAGAPAAGIERERG
jgi:siroheme synthase